jgi:hypothetical protein
MASFLLRAKPERHVPQRSTRQNELVGNSRSDAACSAPGGSSSVAMLATDSHAYSGFCFSRNHFPVAQKTGATSMVNS